MIRRLLCWLGFHEWEKQAFVCMGNDECFDSALCPSCKYSHPFCKHCGKIKK